MRNLIVGFDSAWTPNNSGALVGAVQLGDGSGGNSARQSRPTSRLPRSRSLSGRAPSRRRPLLCCSISQPSYETRLGSGRSRISSRLPSACGTAAYNPPARREPRCSARARQSGSSWIVLGERRIRSSRFPAPGSSKPIRCLHLSRSVESWVTRAQRVDCRSTTLRGERRSQSQIGSTSAARQQAPSALLGCRSCQRG